MRPIPTLIEIRNSVANDLRNKLNLNDDDLRKVVDAFSSVQAAQIRLLYLFLFDIQNNIFPDTADLAENGGQLERIGLIYLNRQPFPATSGLYDVNVTGITGSTLRSGLTFKSNDNSRNPGFLFVLDAEEVLNGTNIFEIRALTSGLDSLLDVGDTLTITEPVIGVEQTITITEITTEPRSSESTDNYRKAILDAIQLEPQGGAKTDYRLWSNDAQGVQKVYPYIKQGEAGVVQIFVEAVLADSTDGFGTPTAALLIDVDDVCQLDPDITKPLNERGRRPIQAALEVLPIEIVPVDVDIIGLNETSIEIVADVLAAITFFLTDVRPYIAGADLIRDKNDILYSGRVQSVITDTLSPTNFFNDFVLYVDGVAVTNYTFSLENIPYLRNVNYT